MEQIVNCPYCKKEAPLIDSIEVYRNKSYGYMYICRPCNAYVGCHRGTKVPLGRLANRELRRRRKEVHYVFDGLWKSNKMTRGVAYKWLSKEMNISRSECHIGKFDVNQCKKVIEICQGIWA